MSPLAVQPYEGEDRKLEAIKVNHLTLPSLWYVLDPVGKQLDNLKESLPGSVQLFITVSFFHGTAGFHSHTKSPVLNLSP